MIFPEITPRLFSRIWFDSLYRKKNTRWFAILFPPNIHSSFRKPHPWTPTLNAVAARPSGAFGRLEALADAVDRTAIVVRLLFVQQAAAGRVGHQGSRCRRQWRRWRRGRRSHRSTDAGPVTRLGTVRCTLAPLGPRRPPAGCNGKIELCKLGFGSGEMGYSSVE